jgi:hypothetical protein
VREQCEAALEGRPPQAGLLFAGIDFEHQELLDAISDAWPGIELIGCTTDGELSSCLGFREDSVSLLLLASDTIDFASGLGRGLSEDAEAACTQAAEQARAKTDLEPRLCITTPEGVAVRQRRDTGGTVKALREALGEDVVLFGGRAADHRKYEVTRQFFGREVVSDSVPILVLSGPLFYSIGVASGWKPIGEPGTITRSRGNVVYEIDGAPAVEFYRRLLGKEFKLSSDIPLIIMNDEGEPEYLRPSSGDVDEETGAITFLSDVPEGVRAQISTTDRASILEGCEEAVGMALSGFPDIKKPEAAVVVSCSARKNLLGTKTPEEFHILRERIGQDIPFCGFYSYGEIGPQKTDSSKSIMHHETFTMLLLGT